MSTQEPGNGEFNLSEKINKMGPIVDILAFFAAARNYGYIDVLGNAIDPALALETVYNLVRDFKSTCIDRKHQPCENAEEGEIDARCPEELKPEWIDAAVRSFAETVNTLYEKGRTGDLVVLYRKLAAKAIGKSFKYMKPCGDEAQKGGASQASQN